MNPKQTWQVWVEVLRRLKALDLAVIFLEAFGPLNLLGAQLIYLGQPILSVLAPAEHLQALANMLEDSVERKAFIEYLREENRP